MSDIIIQPVHNPFSAVLAPPGSKSLTNRALVLAALADGTSTLSNILFADDTLVMLDGLKQLGFDLQIDQTARQVKVHGQAGKIAPNAAEIFCGNSGTTIRFLAALCALGRGYFTLDGVPRMRQRPIGELVDLLRHMGTRISYAEQEGFPPIKIDAHALAGGIVHFGAAKSSQFLSAALMVSPYTRHEVSVDLSPGQTSWPYVAMTMRLMDLFGATVELFRDPVSHEPQRIHVPRGVYMPHDYPVEPDASNATYFLAAAALHPGSSVTIRGLGSHSLQGDVGFAGVLKRMGAHVVVTGDSIAVTGPRQLEGIDVNLADMPDTAQTLAVTAVFAESPTMIRGLQTLRVKETDRLSALASELSKLGSRVEMGDGTLEVYPAERVRSTSIATYDDHRMAMSFALAGTRAPGITILDKECVNKTYPNYFEDLDRAVGRTS